METAIKFYEAKLAAAKEIRSSYETVWADIMDHLAPDLKGYLTVKRKDGGQRTDEVIHDGDPAEYGRKASAGMWSTISSPSRPWMRRKLRRKALAELQEANIWLDEVTETDYDILTDSNFYQEMYSLYLHYMSIGTAVMIIDPDPETIIHCTTLNCDEYYLTVNGKGKPDTLFRELKFSAAQLVDKFGEQNLPQRVLATIRKDRPNGEDFTVFHVIAPDTEKLAPFRKPYLSAYWLSGCHDGKFLQLRGYDRKPFSAPRWFVLSGETYGKMNPGRNQLGNCKQLQSMVFDFYKAMQMVIDPPLQGNEDSLVNGQVVAIPGYFNPLSGSVTGTDGSIRPLYQINPRLAEMWEAIKEKKEQIAVGYYIDLFLAVSMRADKDMTAEEVRTISGEKALALGPGLLNMHVELNEILDIVFDYAIAAGVYPEVPETVLDILAGEELRVEYQSILSQAQKMVDINRIDQVLFYVEKLFAVNPEIIDKFDTDQTIDEIARMTGVPARLIRSDEIVAQIREQRAQAQQAQQQAAMMAEAAKAAQPAAAAARNIAELPMGQDNALSRFLGVDA